MLGRQSDPDSERGTTCPGELPAASDPTLVGRAEAAKAALGDKLFVLENLPPLATMGAKIDFIRSEGGVPGPVVKAKPYTARAIT